MTTRNVVLLTYGEPPAPAFLPQLAYSWRILHGLTRTVAPIPRVALPAIALLRAHGRRRLWSAERYHSPLEPITQWQVAAVEHALAARAPSVRWRVHPAYEFRHPLLPAVLAGIPNDEPVDVIPMYLADSAFTHQLARDTIAAWTRRARRRAAPVRVMPPLAEAAAADVAAAHVRRVLEARRIGGPGWSLVLAAHGTLLEPPRPIETGRAATERIAAAIASRLGDRFDRVVLGWLNHTMGGRWTEPAADQALRSLAAQGARRVVYYPFGFLADNAESQLEGRIALRGCPELESVHLPCLNTSLELADALARQVLGEEPRSPRNAAALNGLAGPAARAGREPAPGARPLAGGRGSSPFRR